MIKQYTHSPSLSQLPLLVAPVALGLQLLSIPDKPMGRKQFNKREFREFKKTADLVERPPWGLTRAAKYLRELLKANEEGTWLSYERERHILTLPWTMFWTWGCSESECHCSVSKFLWTDLGLHPRYADACPKWLHECPKMATSWRQDKPKRAPPGPKMPWEGPKMSLKQPKNTRAPAVAWKFLLCNCWGQAAPLCGPKQGPEIISREVHYMKNWKRLRYNMVIWTSMLEVSSSFPQKHWKTYNLSMIQRIATRLRILEVGHKRLFLGLQSMCLQISDFGYTRASKLLDSNEKNLPRIILQLCAP